MRRNSLSKTSLSKQRNQGFTLIELLVVVVIAGGIISGLLYLVVELLAADQRESSRTQTQQEMQMALDYISAELREAVYVYDQNCLSTTGRGSAGDADFCPGLYNHIPTSLTTNGNVPILAFWKHQILPTDIREDCDDGNAPEGTPCITGHSYALVVYILDKDDNDSTWDGLARIRRYSLFRFDAGYVDPGEYQQKFLSWPFYAAAEGSTPTNQQANIPTGTADVLVDFVDDRIRDGVDSVICPGDPDGNVATVGSNNPEDSNFQPYLLTSDPASVTGVANSFYACVGNRQQTGENRDVIIFLRGNAAGRPGIFGESAFLPTLETRVLSRAVVERQPISN